MTTLRLPESTFTLRAAAMLAALAAVLLALALMVVPAAAQEMGTDEMADSGMADSGMADADDYVPREICAGCHEQGDTFPEGHHGRLMARAGGDLLERSCTICHGPAEKHIEETSKETINRFPKDDACLTCHPSAKGRMSLTTPAHQRFGVACLDCHAPGHPELAHGESKAEPMLAADTAFELCASCHRPQASAARRPFAHREGVDRPFDCTNCHAVHGDNRTGRLLAVGDGGACVACHTEKTGPFVYPHPPRGVNGCTACHEPHGSNNPRLLTRRTVSSLCLECHTNVPSFHDLTQARYRACQTCHVAVHGSNRDRALFDE